MAAATATEAKVVDAQVVEGPGANATANPTSSATADTTVEAKAEAAPATPPAGSPLAEALAKTKAQADAAEAKQPSAPAGAAQTAAASENGGKA